MRTDTHTFPSVALSPLPARLSPRRPRRSVRLVVGLILSASYLAAGLLGGFALPVLAFVVPQPVLVAGIVVLVGTWVVSRAARDRRVLA